MESSNKDNEDNEDTNVNRDDGGRADATTGH